MVSSSKFYLPAQYALNGKFHGNPIRQLLRPAAKGDAEVADYGRRARIGQLIRWSGRSTLVAEKSLHPPDDVDEVLLAANGATGDGAEALLSGTAKARWLKPVPMDLATGNVEGAVARCREVRDSWRGRFHFREEVREANGEIQPGLRAPQVGALHAALAHWKVTDEPATVVMPTGTGKTEAMLALLVSQRLERLLVVVPTAALREQVAEKFLGLGVLKSFGVVDAECLFPIVGILNHRPRTPQEVDDLFLRCNVIVSTMGVAGGCTETVQRRMAELSSHLFIDEAHHIGARTWGAFRRQFAGKPIVQFTATPFRNDGKHVDGKAIFNFPLTKAQEQGFFKPIRFKAINAFSSERADEAIARAAVDQLEADLAAGFDHILMARTVSISRARKIHAIYEEMAPRHGPAVIHSDQTDEERRSAMLKLNTRETRIVVCVDMLGEGFDLPELKIAALHDMHKSLAITLQFTGRFTRTKGTIGDATMVANIADPEVQGGLRALYAEDADWNMVLRTLSEDATGRQLRRSEFIDAFVDVPPGIPLQNVAPKMSAVVYRTRCKDWRPDRVASEWDAGRIHSGPSVNHKDKVLLFVTRDLEPIPWGAIREIQNATWNLFLVHWSADRNLLFINSSDTGSDHEELAKAIAGDDVRLIRGESVFRVLHEVNRFIIMNLGLSHTLSRNIRYSMHVGTDVGPALADAVRQNKAKSNLFGTGYEAGGKASYGCSQKGRVWSYRVAYDMAEWVGWCHRVGEKLADERIKTEDVFRNVILPVEVTDRPALVPLAIDWSEDLLDRKEDLIFVEILGETVPFYEVGLELTDHSREGPIRFRVSTETKSAEYEVSFDENGVSYNPVGAVEAEVRAGRKSVPLSGWFRKNPPILHFEYGAMLMYGDLYQPSVERKAAFDSSRIQVLDWTGIDLKKESQKAVKRKDSIQYRTIQSILSLTGDDAYDIVFDDDDAREVADIVAIKVADERLVVHLFHCKFSGEPTPGGRVDDLYAVCGQAQRSVHWKGAVNQLVRHLRLRNDSRVRKQGVSRFERGDDRALADIAQRLPYLTPEFRIYIVQPGMSRGQVTVEMLELLAATETYVQSTFAAELAVIASE